MEDKSKALFGLDKVPDSELIKALRFELGMLKSEYQELLDQKEHPHAANTEYIRSMEGQIRNLLFKVDRLDNGELKSNHERLVDENSRLKAENEALRSDLLKQLKK